MKNLIGDMVLTQDVQKCLISKACICSVCKSAIKVHDTQAFRNIDMTRERLGFSKILEGAHSKSS